MNKFTIIPSRFKYKSAPENDQKISVSLDEKNINIIEYDRSQVINLSQVYYDERQECNIFRPTFKINFLYDNTYTGTTKYLPFQYNLYYVNPAESKSSGVWKGYPQYYEFDFYRPNIDDGHFDYSAKSSYTYNWGYYLTYSYDNDYQKNMSCVLNDSNFNWVASDGIPFVVRNSLQNGSRLISFECVSPHNLNIGEYVELSLTYSNQKTFQVFSLGNNNKGSEKYIFNIFNVGYTGNTFLDGITGTFKRVINPDNINETKSKYYVRRHKVLTNLEDLVVGKSGFETNIFKDDKKLEFSSVTPNNVTRLSKLTSSYSYTITSSVDLNLDNVIDNQKRPISEIYLTIINKGYSGFFNKPNRNIGLKQGWQFNITNNTNFWWDENNTSSNADIEVSSYTKTNGDTKTFYYNNNLIKGDLIDGDFCEWNDYEQKERVISKYFHKLKFNQNVFQTSESNLTNADGYYYSPHNSMTIRVFSDYIETGEINNVTNIPKYSFFSEFDQQFRWRGLYSYGFIDDLGNGVDYPYLNSSHYPYENVIFRLIPEGSNVNDFLLGVNVADKPLIDDCE